MLGVTGYEVFYQLSSGGSSVMSAGNTTNTMLNIISGLVVYETFNFFVVSYGNDNSTVLPSDHSNITSYVFCECVIYIALITSCDYNTLASPRVNDLVITTTNTTITMTWTPPSFAPQIYQVYRYCRRLCEQTFGPGIHFDSISSPYTFTGIDPGTFCIVGLNGLYGIDTVSLTSFTRITTTLSSGKL